MKFFIRIPGLICWMFTASLCAQTWSFAVIADPRNNSSTYKNALREIRDTRVNPDQKIPPAEFIIAAGDLDPVKARYTEYKKIFKDTKTMKAFFPVKGNHDKGKYTTFITKKILPRQDSITVRDKKHVNYYVDWRNIRCIMVDQYSDLGADGCINSKGRKWVEETIQSAHQAQHVFICFHEPAFPRIRHISDSFDFCPHDRDAFWNMLMKYNTKVKAVFVGHSHYYNRMRVADPASDEALDINKYPDQPGGIYQVDCGSNGEGPRNVIVRVLIDGTDVSFVVLDAENGSKKPFRIIDEWSIPK